MKNNMESEQKLDRKTVEKNRRLHMKSLCFKLVSLIPNHHFRSKDMLSLPNQLALSGVYIQQLKERVEELKRRKQAALINVESNFSLENSTISTEIIPVFEFKDFGSSLEVTFITGMIKKLFMYKVINILTEEGAEVLSASVSTIGDRVFHTFHAQVKVSRVGVDTSRVCQRLQELIT